MNLTITELPDGTSRQDDHMALSRSITRIVFRSSNYGSWYDGEVVTKQGIVTVYAEVDHVTRDPFVRFDFAWRGRMYLRTYHGKRYTRRGMARKAREFAEEVVGKPDE